MIARAWGVSAVLSRGAQQGGSNIACSTHASSIQLRPMLPDCVRREEYWDEVGDCREKLLRPRRTARVSYKSKGVC